ncbi:hypothetical protein TCSYLVIO_001710 [Trypanosoma cruzi]|nr:hypothetical protein TCSYLVIO_001710 [Trypanosoma cruzi]
MSAVWMYGRGSELTAYTPGFTEVVHDRIDCFVPPAYTRLPVPLQEARTFYTAPADFGANGFAVLPTERLGFFLDQEEPNTKHALLKELVGQPEHSCSSSSSSLLSVPHIEETIASRLRGLFFDASHVKSSELMVELVSHIFLSCMDPKRMSTGCIATVDLSHTVLGTVGLWGPQVHVDTHGNPSWRHRKDICYFPDKRFSRSKIKWYKLQCMALRSLALAYVAPLLWMPGFGRFQVVELSCHHCCLGDQDAKALAFILRKRCSSGYVCLLETIDLSFNNITDDGADALKKAIKYNKRIRNLLLAGNEGIRKTQILVSINKRLKRNKEGRDNWTLLQHLKWLIKGY